MSEQGLLNRIRLSLSRQGILNFRNNTGALRDDRGRLVRYGLCPGSADIIGIKPIIVTQEMVGQRVGVFVAVEVKLPRGRLTAKQELFLRRIEDAGGIALIARHEDDVACVR